MYLRVGYTQGVTSHIPQGVVYPGCKPPYMPTCVVYPGCKLPYMPPWYVPWVTTLYASLGVYHGGYPLLLYLPVYHGGYPSCYASLPTRFTVGQFSSLLSPSRFTVGLGRTAPPYHPFHCWARKGASSPSPVSLLG